MGAGPGGTNVGQWHKQERLWTNYSVIIDTMIYVFLTPFHVTNIMSPQLGYKPRISFYSF